MKLCTWYKMYLEFILGFPRAFSTCHKYKRNDIKPGKILTAKYFIAEYNPSALLFTVSGRTTRHRTRPSRRRRHDTNMVGLPNFEYAFCSFNDSMVNHKFLLFSTQRHLREMLSLSWLNPFLFFPLPSSFSYEHPVKRPSLLVFHQWWLWPPLSFLPHSFLFFPRKMMVT